MSNPSWVRWLWILPLLTGVLTLHQIRVAYDAHRTWTKGTPAVADVVAYERKDMAAQAHGIVTLRVPLADGRAIERTLSMPITLIYKLENLKRVPVRVLPGSGQEIVFEELAGIQLRMAVVNTGVAGLMTLILIFGIGAWMRYLRRKGDPAFALGDTGDGGLPPVDDPLAVSPHPGGN